MAGFSGRWLPFLVVPLYYTPGVLLGSSAVFFLWLIHAVFFTHKKNKNKNKVVWMEEKNGSFFFKSLFKMLDSTPSFYFPANIIWRPKIQPRIYFFAWEAAWGKASTLDQLQKRGRHLANRCFLCQRMEETTDHLLLHCGMTRVL